MFNYVYLLGIRNRLEDNVRIRIGSLLPAATNPNIRDSDYQSNIDMNDDDMSRLQEIAPDDYMSHRRDLPGQEREPFQFEVKRDHSSWMNRYDQEREQTPPDEYPFHNFNYGP